MAEKFRSPGMDILGDIDVTMLAIIWLNLGQGASSPYPSLELTFVKMLSLGCCLAV